MKKKNNISAKRIRQLVLEQSRRANVGHIGSCLCLAEIFEALYGHLIKVVSPGDPDRDRFILSKGHAALALYATLYLKGLMDLEELNSYCGDNSRLGVHPERTLPGVDFSTGSLGLGLSMGVGAALAARIQGSSRQVYVLLSDAEMNEGSVWEAVMFAGHHKLGNLKIIVDDNKQQALDYTNNVLDMSRLDEKLENFGWNAGRVNGHDIDALVKALQPDPDGESKPRAIIADTIFAKGVSFMEGKIKWHYMPMSDDEYRLALAEVVSQ